MTESKSLFKFKKFYKYYSRHGLTEWLFRTDLTESSYSQPGFFNFAKKYIKPYDIIIIEEPRKTTKRRADFIGSDICAFKILY